MKKTLKITALISIFILLAGGFWVYKTYEEIYAPNLNINKEADFLYIPTHSNFDDLVLQLQEKHLLKNIASFKKVADLKSFKNVKPGRYTIHNNMSNNALINMLRIGDQSPVHITFNHIRTLKQLAGKVSINLECDSVSLVKKLYNSKVQKKYGFNSYTFISMFIANTYELYWNTSADDFIKRMATEYKKFWNKKRKAKAQNLGLSQSEITTLASIVELESLKNDEKPRIAGVYLNRLKKGMLLQADPTVIFAVGDFSIKRVLKKYLNINSPYNTYKYTGLPPGPIYLPSISSIDAVLNYEHHSYIYFCAKEDFSGYHNFAKSYFQHINNARKYQRALNKRKIYK